MIIDLCAGPGGWDEGVRLAGYTGPLVGFEFDESACATAEAAGHDRVCVDITTLDPRAFKTADVDGLIGSPPCQGFSVAGSGKSRDDAALLLKELAGVATLAELEDLIERLAHRMTDPRTLVVLEPLRWALALNPRWVAWEQVPAVLPIWKACADVLERFGFSVDSGLVGSEQYGVPQTRVRAILVARRDGPVAMLPKPTHSKFYVRDPESLDAGLPRWVSMSDALGWGGAVFQSNYSAGGRPGQTAAERGRGVRTMDQPCFGLTSKPNRWVPDRVHALTSGAVDVGGVGGGRLLTVAETGVLQSFRADYPWSGVSHRRQVGDAVPPLLARAIVAPMVEVSGE